eukprot:scaffold2.g6815.t1
MSGAGYKARRCEMEAASKAGGRWCDRHWKPNPVVMTTYLERMPDIGGWVVPLQLTAVRTIEAVQRNHCVVGSVGEIGVHHGKFLLLMAALSRPGEQKVAIDVFSQQDLNIDQSGGAQTDKRSYFELHAKKLGWDPEKDIKIIDADSASLTPYGLAKHGVQAFRMLSVDGSHMYQASGLSCCFSSELPRDLTHALITVLKDMQLATCSIHDGGVFMVNDFVNSDWVGVMEAVADFVRRRPFMAPFLWACNKLYFSHAAWHGVYLSAVRANPCLQCTMDRENMPHPSKYMLGRWPVCIAMRNCSRTLEQVEEACF